MDDIEDLDPLADAVGVVLEPHGFRGRKAVFNRETEPGLVQVVALERWRDDGTGEQRVDVLPGVWLQEVDRALGGTGRAGWVSEAGCHLHLRDGPLLDHPGMGWALAAGAHAVARFTADQVVPVLERLASRSDLLAAWETSAGTLGMGAEEVARAAVLVGTGDPDRACAVLQEAFERSRRGGRPRLHEITARLGLPPLETGSAPDRSGAEDEFLGRWTALPEERRLDDVRAFVRALGGPAKKLDGSVRSLGPLWDWMLDAVPRLEESGPDGPLAAPTGLCRSVENVSDANRLLAENVGVYLGVVLLRRFPEARWDLDDAGFGLELAVSGVPAGVARVVERTCNEVARLVARPDRPRRRVLGLRRRDNPLQDLVGRWST
ncbi:MAG TPA: hypothetical protein VHH09_08520 [Acidimicrobiales bacterium]|nr:hypothetical protein [Acidimicrobiales bacterium]